MIKNHAFLFIVILSFLSASYVAAQPNRIAGRIDNTRRIALSGHIHPKATPENDQGVVDPAVILPRITLVLKASPAQQSDLDQLLANQQNPASADYHRWLTPEQYAERFGASQDDVNQMVQWLGEQHLTVLGVARGRNWVAASGTVGAVQSAFGTEIHYYLVENQQHFANATEPTIPAAFQGIVGAIQGLHDFRMKPALRAATMGPEYTSASGRHYLAPDDVATIYNIKPLYSGGFTGSGQKLVVAGQTKIDLADVRQFRSYFNLTANDPQLLLVPNTPDPGTSQSDVGEANLDLQWSGAVARDASIIYVYSTDVMASAQYAIDQNLAPVLSMSYGSCEAENFTADATSLQASAKQANAQGITWFNAAGDSGATDCAGSGTSQYNSVLSVDMPASIPEVTGVGGSEFAEGGGNYWNASGDSNHASALSYIPETAWNDSAAGSPAAGGGGASIFFAKPSWQSGTGVPGDGARDVPDVSLAASANHDGYVTFNNGSMQIYGGASAGTPWFAGLATLLNQYLVSNGAQSSPGLGNINPQLYSLARTAPAVFHDITTGNNLITVACGVRSRNCTPGSFGFNAGAGYDQATGLGSVDAYALATSWKGQNPSAVPGPPSITAVGNGASFNQRYAPGMLLSIYGAQLSPVTQTFSSVPLPMQMGGVSVTINGIAAPLYYVSSGQLNVQIPFETPATSVVLKVNNNGLSASTSFTVAAAAPGIFTDANGAPVPSTTGSRSENQLLTLYITGYGEVTPAVPTGAGPAVGTSLPQPQQKVTVTVGGVASPSVLAAVPWGYVGVMQINYQVPATTPLGAQPVVVTVGVIASAPATLTVTP